MEKILIVEDDADINEVLCDALKKAGYTCVQAFSGTEGHLMLKQERFALVLLDLMLPGMTGEEFINEIRRKSNIPIIVLTAKDSLDNKVDVLVNGADDYITKPFELKEVLARIKVQLRHQNAEMNTGQLHYMGMVLDRDTFTITIDGKELKAFTRQEFAIMELLMRHPRQVFSKEDIFSYAWEEEYMGETKTLDVHISNIRKKIKQVTEQEYIETVWGIGYRLAAQ